MILKRLGALALAVILIGGAWIIRDRVIDDNGGSSDDDPPRADREIVCVEALREACQAIAESLEIEIRIEDAGVTLDALAALEQPSSAPIWVTLEPLPAMVESLREVAHREPLVTVQSAVASSTIALVMQPDRAAVLAAACSEFDWTCIGQAAGDPWEDIGGTGLPGDVRPAFAPIDTAIGLLGVADAVAGYFRDAPIDVNDGAFLGWARRLGTSAVPQSALTGGTPIATIQTRRSALDIAVGAEAELSDTEGSRLTLEYADPMIRADAVVSVPQGASAPDGLASGLMDLLVTEGNWDPASTEPNPLPVATEMVAIRSVWGQLS